MDEIGFIASMKKAKKSEGAAYARIRGISAFALAYATKQDWIRWIKLLFWNRKLSGKFLSNTSNELASLVSLPRPRKRCIL